MRRFAVYQLPWIAYAGLIIIVSSISKLPDPKIEFEYIDKLAHFGEYFLFFLLTYRALANFREGQPHFSVYIVSVVLSIIFAALDEYHQSFVKGRQSDIYDLGADTIGIVLGALLHYLFGRRKLSSRR
ncbi:MAG: VanZ family protein [FCB group bacterium]|nr:VanZ family protein [FCB group bacterium]